MGLKAPTIGIAVEHFDLYRMLAEAGQHCDSMVVIMVVLPLMVRFRRWLLCPMFLACWPVLAVVVADGSCIHLMYSMQTKDYGLVSASNGMINEFCRDSMQMEQGILVIIARFDVLAVHRGMFPS